MRFKFKILIAGLLIISVLIITIATETLSPRSKTTPLSFTPELCTPMLQQMDTYNQIAISRQPSGSFYDEQLWLGFANNATAMSYNVTAIAQNDTYGFGPGYLVNGLTNKNVWYQVGLTWNWDYVQSLTHRQGFDFFYQVWNATSKKPMFPNTYGSAGLIPFTKPVRSGDNVLLSLTIRGGEINMSARDWESNATASIDFSSYGADVFVGSTRPVEYPTSLLTEWYHVLPFFCSNQAVRYSNQIMPARPGWLGIDEWNFTGIPYEQRFNASDKRQILFSNQTDVSPLTSTVVGFEGNGTRIYANSTEFWTM